MFAFRLRVLCLMWFDHWLITTHIKLGREKAITIWVVCVNGYAVIVGHEVRILMCSATQMYGPIIFLGEKKNLSFLLAWERNGSVAKNNVCETCVVRLVTNDSTAKWIRFESNYISRCENPFEIGNYCVWRMPSLIHQTLCKWCVARSNWKWVIIHRSLISVMKRRHH